MKAKKCDRCGKYYKENTMVKEKFDAFLGIVGHRNTGVKITSDDVKRNGKVKKTEFKFCLCDECMASFENWFEYCESEE